MRTVVANQSRRLLLVAVPWTIAIELIGANRASAESCTQVLERLKGGAQALAMSCSELETATRALAGCTLEDASYVRIELGEAQATKRCECNGLLPNQIVGKIQSTTTVAKLEQWRDLLRKAKGAERCFGETGKTALAAFKERVASASFCSDSSDGERTKALRRADPDQAQGLGCSEARDLRDELRVLRECPAPETVAAAIDGKASVVERRIDAACQPSESSSTYPLVEAVNKQLRACRDAPTTCPAEQLNRFEQMQMRYLATHLMAVSRKPITKDELKHTLALLAGVGVDPELARTALGDALHRKLIQQIGQDKVLAERLLNLAATISPKAAEILKGLPKEGDALAAVFRAVESMTDQEQLFFFESAGVLSSEKEAVRAQATREKHPSTLDVIISPARPSACGPFETFYARVEFWLTGMAGIATPSYVDASEYASVLQRRIDERARRCGRRDIRTAVDGENRSCGAVLGIALSDTADRRAGGMATLTLIVPTAGPDGRKSREVAMVPIPEFESGCDQRAEQTRAAREFAQEFAGRWSLLHMLPGIEYYPPAEVYQNPACGIALRTDVTAKQFALAPGQGLNLLSNGADGVVLKGVRDALKAEDPNAKLIGTIGVDKPAGVSLVFQQYGESKHTATLRVGRNAVYSVAAVLKDPEPCGISAEDLRYGAGEALGNRVAGVLIGAALAAQYVTPEPSVRRVSIFKSPWFWGGAGVALAATGTGLVLSSVSAENEAVRSTSSTSKANTRLAFGLSLLVSGLLSAAAGVVLDVW